VFDGCSDSLTYSRRPILSSLIRLSNEVAIKMFKTLIRTADTSVADSFQLKPYSYVGNEGTNMILMMDRVLNSSATPLTKLFLTH
jgi:hypothetical protein